MSSVTVLFILERFLRSPEYAASDLGVPLVGALGRADYFVHKNVIPLLPVLARIRTSFAESLEIENAGSASAEGKREAVKFAFIDSTVALSFALYYLVRHPEALATVQAETDAILGPDPDATPSYEQVARFRYIRKVLDEALRLWPTAPGYARSPRETTTLGGRWTMTPDDWALVFLPLVQRDPAVWGETADTFDPDRPRPRLASTAKPFGTGERACIGRQFAVHEATMALARILHRYDVTGDPAYELRIDERLTLMPQGMELTLSRRTPGLSATGGAARGGLPRPRSHPPAAPAVPKRSC